ncbi:unnamed protein product [Symbiodinium sp. CCMP2592]|nr:unnamed protein product [Symbiodinium sp. CCMP2592]
MLMNSVRGVPAVRSHSADFCCSQCGVNCYDPVVVTTTEALQDAGHLCREQHCGSCDAEAPRVVVRRHYNTVVRTAQLCWLQQNLKKKPGAPVFVRTRRSPAMEERVLAVSLSAILALAREICFSVPTLAGLLIYVPLHQKPNAHHECFDGGDYDHEMWSGAHKRWCCYKYKEDSRTCRRA